MFSSQNRTSTLDTLSTLRINREHESAMELLKAEKASLITRNTELEEQLGWLREDRNNLEITMQQKEEELNAMIKKYETLKLSKSDTVNLETHLDEKLDELRRGIRDDLVDFGEQLHESIVNDLKHHPGYPDQIRASENDGLQVIDGKVSAF